VSSSGIPLPAHAFARHCLTASIAYVIGPLYRRVSILKATEALRSLSRMFGGGEENKEGDCSDMRSLEEDRRRTPTDRASKLGKEITPRSRQGGKKTRRRITSKRSQN